MDKTKNLIKLIIENHNKVFDKELVLNLLSNKDASFFNNFDIVQDLGYCSFKMNLWSFICFTFNGEEQSSILNNWKNLLESINPDYVKDNSYIFNKRSYYNSTENFSNFFNQDFEISLDAILSLKDFSLNHFHSTKDKVIDFEYKDNKKFFLNEVFSLDSLFIISDKSYKELVEHTQKFIVSDFDYFLKSYYLSSLKKLSHTALSAFNSLSKDDLNLVIKKYKLEDDIVKYVKSFRKFSDVKNILENYQTKEFWLNKYSYIDKNEFSLSIILNRNAISFFGEKFSNITKINIYSRTDDSCSFIDRKNFNEKSLIEELKFFKEYIKDKDIINKLIIIASGNNLVNLYCYLTNNYVIDDIFLNKAKMIVSGSEFSDFFLECKKIQANNLQQELVESLNVEKFQAKKVKV